MKFIVHFMHWKITFLVWMQYNQKLIMVMDLRKVTGVMLLTLMIFSYVSFRTEWNYFMFIHMIQFFKFVDLPLEYWVFLDRYVFNGAL